MDKHSVLILVYLVTVSVKVMLMNAFGWLSCNRAAPRPYLLASVWMAMSFSLS